MFVREVCICHMAHIWRLFQPTSEKFPLLLGSRVNRGQGAGVIRVVLGFAQKPKEMVWP